MRRIEPAEHAVPVSIVALASQQKSRSLFARLPYLLIARFALRKLPYFSRDVQHFLLQQVRLVVFCKKTPPDAPAQEWQRLRPRGELLSQRVITFPRLR